MSKTWLLLAGVVGLLMGTGYARAEDYDDDQPPPNSVIRSITIEPGNVFDPHVPGEDRWPFTWANVLHIRTKAHIIRRELLQKPGQRSKATLREESERNLRALPFIRGAEIREVSAPGGGVDWYVKTKDSWTTQPQINFRSEGGETHSEYGLLEENLLGYGKRVGYFLRHNSSEGDSHDISYADPQLFGSRAKLSTQLVDTPTGNQQHINLSRPFYSLETPYAAGVFWNHNIGRTIVSNQGVEINRYVKDHHDLDSLAGMRLNNNPLDVKRVEFHYKYYADLYQREAQTAPNGLPRNNTITGPHVLFTRTESNYIKESYIESAERVEDINLGHLSGLGVGYAGREIGSTDRSVPFQAYDAFGHKLGDESFGLFSYGLLSRYALDAPLQLGGNMANTLYFVNANVYSHFETDIPVLGVLHAESAYAQNSDQPGVLQLGGDTGLRGYKVQSYTGNKSMLFNAETRTFYPREWFHLFYLGGVAFVDSGQVQPQGLPFRARDMHTNVGVGLRIALTRSSSGSVVRIDLAYALGPIQQQDRLILSLSIGSGFRRAGNTYGSFFGVPQQL